MASWQLPDFYMPWPARQNRHLPATQAHTTAWAREMGFFDEGNAAGWTQARYERAEFPLFLALVYPDAPGAKLDAVTDYYVWSFFFDDLFFHTFTPSGDLDGAAAFVARLEAFLPLDGRAESAPQPENVVERALLDVWLRIAPPMSAEWTRRCARNIQDMNESWLWELANATENRVPDPIEYVEMRRRTGGVFWAADLVEYVLAIEVPARIYPTRPIRVLGEIFCDTVLLRNDILSYEKEMEEGERNNSVLVAQEFLGCDVQRAVDVVNDVVTARLQQAELTMIAEIEPLLDEHRADPHERLEVHAYVRGLRDAMSGDYQWETGSGRYHDEPPRWLPAESPIAGWIPEGPSGLGTIAARLGAHPRMLGLRLRSQAPAGPDPLRPVATGTRPQARPHPGLSALRSHARAWAREHELLDVGGWGIWDARRFDEMDLALLVASAHPGAATADLELIACWHVWAFYFDDFFAEMFRRPYNLAGARTLVARLPAFMPTGAGGAGAAHAAVNPVERALADAWSRSAGEMSEIVSDRLRRDVLVFARSWLWELECHVQRRVPEPLDYVLMRRQTSRAGFAADLVQHALRVELTPKQIATGPLSPHAAFGDVAGLRNDVVSYPRETQVEGAVDNGVLVLQRFLDCEIELAGDIVSRLAEVRQDQLERVSDGEASGCADVARYAQGLRDWLAGAQSWSLQTGRYAVGRARMPIAAAGLGTSAARPR